MVGAPCKHTSFVLTWVFGYTRLLLAKSPGAMEMLECRCLVGMQALPCIGRKYERTSLIARTQSPPFAQTPRIQAGTNVRVVWGPRDLPAVIQTKNPSSDIDLRTIKWHGQPKLGVDLCRVVNLWYSMRLHEMHATTWIGKDVA
jgi:hypothetical protein